MREYVPSQLRTVALLGHQGSGKTSLVESMLEVAGVIPKKGSVDDGSTISDYTKEEKSQHASIYSALIPIEWNDYKYNFIDTPGFFDFGNEVIQALRVARASVIVVDATKGIEVGTMKHWRYVRNKSIPTIVFINKMDKENIKFDELIDSIREKLGTRAVPFSWPIGHGEAFEGFVNVVDMRARLYNGKECIDADIWPERMEQVKKLHEMIVESVANFDDVVLEKYLNGEEISNEEIHQGLRQGVLEGKLVPVLVGSSVKNVGIHTLLHMIGEYLPSEQDMRQPFGEALGEFEIVERKVDTAEPFSAFVFKTVVDPFIGKISFVSVRSGSLKKDLNVLNATKDVKERVNNISFLRGKDQLEAQAIPAGDIGVIMKMASLETGDTLCDPAYPIKYDVIDSLPPSIYFAMVVKDKKDDAKITEALRRIASEDLSIVVERNAETKQLLVGCQGQSHIDVIIEKLKTMYNIQVGLEDARISYRETIKGTSDVEGRYVKQSGGSGQYGIVKIKFEPSDEPFTFVNDIFGGSVPSNYVPAVQKGLEDAMKTGVLAGFPVIGLKAILHDGKYHPVDSSELAFKMAASFAFKEGCKAAKPTILEPIMEICVVAPSDYVGDIMGDLNKRRGIIIGIEPVGDEQYITADVPQSELSKYIIDLKTMTQAQASFTMKFVRYQEVPSQVVDKIVQAAAQLKEQQS